VADKQTRRRVQSSSVTTVVSLSLVLFMLGLLGLIVLNTNKLSDYVKENIAFQIILSDKATDADIAKLRKTLDASEYAKKTEYTTKEDAAAKLKEDLGEDFISFLGFNPLLPSINVNLKAAYANTDSVAWIEKEILQNNKVKELNYQPNLIKMVNENAKNLSLIILVFSVLLLVIALALINNTIRLAIYSQRFLIKTMQLVGATQGFIRKPFILKGMLNGVYGAVISIGMLIGLLYLAARQFPELVMIQDVELLGLLFGLVLLAGTIIAGISTYLAVRKYLRIKADDLYY